MNFSDDKVTDLGEGVLDKSVRDVESELLIPVRANFEAFSLTGTSSRTGVDIVGLEVVESSVAENGSSYTFMGRIGVIVASSEEESALPSVADRCGCRSPVIVGTTIVKSSSPFEGLDDTTFCVATLVTFGDLARGEGTFLLTVGFAGLV